ncbi:MAG: AMP-binding protein, partial [Pseudomonadota bacterium]
TSGTTVFPKGALLTHASMLYDSWQCVRRLKITPEDRWTSMIPLFHCAGCIMNVMGCIQAGACYVGVSSFAPEQLFAVIERERCTALSGVPTAYLAMLDHPARQEHDLSSLRTGTCGGADANPDILKQCAEEFPIPELCNVYGLTESSTIVACPHCDDPERFDTSGAARDGAEIRITHPQTREALATGEVGQVEARGPMVMREYYRNPQASAETVDPTGWLLTGDLGYLTPSGKLCLAGGRIKDMIIRGGENIYPVEIENALITHPAVEQIAVFAIPDEYYGEVPAAALVSSNPPAVESLRAFCRDQLAAFKVPHQWYALEQLPLTASGKIRKVALREMAAKGELTAL